LLLNSEISHNYLSGESDEDDFVGGRGGGLAVEESTLIIINSKVKNNTATASGGGIYALASGVAIIDSTISGNSALALGEYSDAIGGGGIYMTMRSSSFTGANSQIKMYGSTVDNNISARDGGGILIAPQMSNGAADVISYNSTISNNSATFLGGGVHHINDGDFGAYATTISANTSVNGAGGISASGAEAALSIGNSIVAGNRSTSSSHEIRLTSGAIFNPFSQANVFGQAEFTNAESFIGVTISAANIFATSNGSNPQVLDQIISPLRNNGGRTRTHALPKDSIAIDNGVEFICDDYLTVDQRGPNNRKDNECDIGSVEYFDESCFVVPTKNSKLVFFCL
jgi:predicted outer membrane repeat protein